MLRIFDPHVSVTNLAFRDAGENSPVDPSNHPVLATGTLPDDLAMLIAASL